MNRIKSNNLIFIRLIIFSLLFIVLNTGSVFSDNHENITNKRSTSATVSHSNPFIICMKGDGNLFPVDQHETRAELFEFFGIKENEKMWTQESMGNSLLCATESKIISGSSITNLFLKYYGYK